MLCYAMLCYAMLCYAMLCYQEGNVYEGNEAGNKVVREGVDNGVVQAKRGGGDFHDIYGTCNNINKLIGI